MHLSRPYPRVSEGLLYPIMWICALGVIVFSVLGMLTMGGWIPRSEVSNTSRIVPQRDPTTSARVVSPDSNRGPALEKAASAFQCAECGVIDSIRDLEGAPVMRAPAPTPAAPPPGR